MFTKLLLLCLLAGSIVFFGLRQISQQSGLKIDKTSPNGEYRVEIELRKEKATGTRDENERLKITYSRGNKVVSARESVNSDQYEPSLSMGFEVVTWVAGNVLYKHRNEPPQPFQDRLVVSNNTEEPITLMNVSYGRYHTFTLLDLAPKSKVSLSASPGFMPDSSSNYFLGFGGKTLSGKEFHSTMEKKRRQSPADGPLEFQIEINTRDLR